MQGMAFNAAAMVDRTAYLAGLLHQTGFQSGRHPTVPCVFKLDGAGERHRERRLAFLHIQGKPSVGYTWQQRYAEQRAQGYGENKITYGTRRNDQRRCVLPGIHHRCGRERNTCRGSDEPGQAPHEPTQAQTRAYRMQKARDLRRVLRSHVAFLAIRPSDSRFAIQLSSPSNTAPANRMNHHSWRCRCVVPAWRFTTGASPMEAGRTAANTVSMSKGSSLDSSASVLAANIIVRAPPPLTCAS